MTAGKVVRLYHVPERGDWCIVWRTPTMAAPSFWYFETLDGAVEAMRGLGWVPTWI